MHDKPKLQVTRDYSIFKMNPINRELAEKPVLLASMKAHGFMPSSPIHCVPNGKAGSLIVVRGHHRLDYAKRLGLPVWYVVDNSTTDIYELEGDNSSHWSLRDFIFSRARGGDEQCLRVLKFQAEHGLNLSSAIDLMAGESAGSKNHQDKIKRGTFQVGDDLSHAASVVAVTDHFRSVGVQFATQAALLKAVSLALRVPECDPNIIKHRITQWPASLNRRSNYREYLQELEALYNYGAKAKRLPLAHLAHETARQRKATFGGNSALGRKRAKVTRSRRAQ